MKRTKTKSVQLNKSKIHFLVLGDTNKTPLIMVHGLAVSGSYMMPTAELLSNHFAIYVLDLPGYGKSSKPNKTYSIKEHTATIIEWMDAVGLTKAIFLGNSFGCQIIVELADAYPAKVSHAILIGPTMDAHARKLPIQTFRLFKDGIYEPLSYYPHLFYGVLKAGVARILQTAKIGLKQAPEKLVANMQIPTLVVRGEKDPIVPQQWVEEVTRKLPQGTLKIIPGAGHAVNFNAPNQLAREVLSFLKKH